MTQEPLNKILRRIEIRVPAAKIPERLDVFLARQVAELTRSMAQDAIEQGIVKIDGKTTKPAQKIKPGQLIELEIMSRPPLELTAEEIPLDIRYEDEWLVVLNKPTDLVVHPAQGNRSGTLVNALLGHYETLAQSDDPDRPGLVHRLDKNTTGLMVVCKQEPALSRLARAFRERTIEREYWAITWWPFQTRKGVIDKPLGRDPRDRKKYTVLPGGKNARTHWEVIEGFDFMNFMSLHLETGRTHQIRVHMSNIGHPVFGDPDYAGRNRQVGRLSSAQRKEVAEYFAHINRQMLHAHSLGFEHPVTGEDLLFKAEPPADFQWLLDQLRSLRDARLRGGMVE